MLCVLRSINVITLENLFWKQYAFTLQQKRFQNRFGTEAKSFDKNGFRTETEVYTLSRQNGKTVFSVKGV